MRKTFATIAVLFVGVISCAGCGPLTTPVDESKPSDTTTIERAPADEIFGQLSKRVPTTITSTNQLALFVADLANNGDLSAADVTRFDSAFPDATTKDRDLTADDAVKLKGIK